MGRTKQRIPTPLALLRLSRGFSQQRLAKRVRMSQPVYSQLEQGNRPASRDEAERIATVLGVDLADLGIAIPEQEQVSA